MEDDTSTRTTWDFVAICKISWDQIQRNGCYLVWLLLVTAQHTSLLGIMLGMMSIACLACEASSTDTKQQQGPCMLGGASVPVVMLCGRLSRVNLLGSIHVVSIHNLWISTAALYSLSRVQGELATLTVQYRDHIGHICHCRDWVALSHGRGIFPQLQSV